MNKEEIEKYKNKFLDKEMIIKFLEANRQNEYGFIEMDCKSVCVLLDYINQLEEKIRISQEHPFLSKEAFEKLKKIKIEEDKEIGYLLTSTENNKYLVEKINELVKAVNELKKGK